MKRFWRSVGFVVLSLCVFGNLSSSALAQVNSDAAPTPSATPPTTAFPSPGEHLSAPILVAEVNVYNAKIASQNGGTFQIKFDLSNGKQAQSDIHFVVDLIQKSTDGKQAPKLADEWVSPNVVSLDAKQTLPEQITYTAPAYLSGSYQLMLFTQNSSGLTLALSGLGDVTLSGNGQYVGIQGESCFLTVVGDAGHKYQLSQGVDIKADESLNLSCNVQNHTDKTVSLTPKFATFFRSILGDSVTTPQIDQSAITLAPQEQKAVTVAVPKAADPQAYDALFTLTDGQVKTNSIRVHYVVQGESASISNLMLDKIAYAAGDTARASFIWTGRADNFPGARLENTQALGSVFALVRIADETGAACSAEVKTALNDQSPRQEISVPITGSCGAPQVDAQIVDSNGKILAHTQFHFQATRSTSETQPEVDAQGSSPWVLTVLLITLALVVLVLVWRLGQHRRRGQKSVLIFLLAGIFGAAFLFGSTGSARANTFYSVGWGGNGFVAFTDSVSTNSVPYGSPITAWLWVTGADCLNRIGDGYTFGSIGLDGNMPGWTNMLWPTLSGSGISSTFWPTPGSHYVRFGGLLGSVAAYDDSWFRANNPPTPSIYSFYPSPNPIPYGAGTGIYWGANDGAYCYLYGGYWPGGTPVSCSGAVYSGALYTNTPYSIVEYNLNWSAYSQAWTAVLVNGPPSITGLVNPNPVAYGGSTGLYWGSSNANHCYLIGGQWGWSGWTDLGGWCNGGVATGALTADTQYGVLGYNETGYSSVSYPWAYVKAQPTVTAWINPNPVSYGTGTNVNWSSSNATHCWIIGGQWGWSKWTDLGGWCNGSVATSALTADTQYGILASNEAGYGVTSYPWAYVGSIPTGALSANPNPVPYAESTTLSWVTSNAATCFLHGGQYSNTAVDCNSSVVTNQLTANATYGLTVCAASGGCVESNSITVSVNPPIFKICQDSCSGATLSGKTAPGVPVTLVACSGQGIGCNATNVNNPVNASWSVSGSSAGSIILDPSAGTSASSVLVKQAPNTLDGSAVVSGKVGSTTLNVNFNLSCNQVCTLTKNVSSVCSGTTISGSKCGGSGNCSGVGTKSCNSNWSEVAP